MKTINIKYFAIIFLLVFILQSIEARTRRYRCMLRSEPSTTITIGWELVSGNYPVVYYGTTDYGQDFYKYPNQAQAQRTIHAKDMHNHFARLSKLQPNTIYYFVIKDSESTSRRFSFKTLPDDHQTRLSILGGGDSRNHKTARRNANKMVAKIRPHFVMFAGDMTGGDSSSEWQEWLDDWQLTIGSDGRMTAVVAARGNHERSDMSIVDMFDVPHPTVFYGLTFARGLIRIITLNSMQQSNSEQLAWLKNDLANSQNIAWRMAQYHHPMRPHTRRKHEQEYLRKYWAPLFYKYSVQLALECDSHMSKITWPVRATNDKSEIGYEEGFVRDSKGTVFIGEGGWGAPLRDPDDAKSWTRAIGSFNQIKWLMVDLNKIELRTIKTENADEVVALTDNNRFYMPTNIDLWPVNGANEVVLFNHKINTFKPKAIQVLMEINPLTANFLDAHVYLEWKTKHEIKGAKYKVQVSTNKLYWKTIAILPSLGPAASRNHTYKYTDKTDRKGGKYYYRIVAVDRLSKEVALQYTEVRSLGSEELEVAHASIHSGQLKVPIEVQNDSEVFLELFDTQRKQVFVGRFKTPKGYHVLPLNIRHLKPGFYLLEISVDGRLIKKSVKISS